MMRYTLIGDGSSDKCLIEIVNWALGECWPGMPFTAQYADFRRLKNPPKILQDKVNKAVELYPCDILFIHRDAEKTKQNEDIYQERIAEIQQAIQSKTNYVPIIPIKMMETWLLTDATAIRRAAGNRNNTVDLALPSLNKLETESNPKELLYECLRKASGLKGRQLKDFNERQAIHRAAENTTDFSKLRNLFAFTKFEENLKTVIEAIKNNGTQTLSAAGN